MAMLATAEETNITSQSRAPQTMKAAVIRQFGDVDALQYENIDTPRPQPGHILIKVLAAGVNRLDHYIREGSIVSDLPFPHTLGADAVGEVKGEG
jgi:NADPH:quinone reductase-like Zn-dependent oxidoreductase